MTQFEELKAIWLDLRAHVDQLAGERQHYLDFFEQSAEAYVVTDATGTIVEANAAATDILHRRRRYLRGRPIAALVALDRRTQFRGQLRRLLAREPATQPWNTIFEAPGLRIEVKIAARLIEREEGVGGVCWRLQAAP